jgi:carboxylesterase type B
VGVSVGDVAETVGAAMRRYWVRFAAAGNPNEPGLPEWPVYVGAGLAARRPWPSSFADGLLTATVAG